MKKNWVLFIAIFLAGFIITNIQRVQEQAEYEEKLAEYEKQLAEWEITQQAAEEEKQKAIEELEAIQKQLAGNGEESVISVPESGASDEPTTTTVSESSSVPSMSSMDVEDRYRELIETTNAISQAESYVVETDLYKVVISELGARPIRWQIKSSRFVSNVPEDGVDPEDPEATLVDLIPQVEDVDARSYPLELSGRTARDFNSKIFSLERENVEGGEILRFTSDEVYDLKVVKEYFFRDDSYVVDLDVTFINGPSTRKSLGSDNQGWGIGWQGGFGMPQASDRVHGTVTAVLAYDEKVRTRSVSRKSEEQRYEDMVDWIGQEKKFFAALIFPLNELYAEEARVTFRRSNDTKEYLEAGAVPMDVEMYHPNEPLALGETKDFSYQLYVGPRNLEALNSDYLQISANAVNPAELVFHQVPLGMSFLRPLSLLLLKLMRWLHDLIGMWGLAIICTTIIVRLVLYPLTHWAIKNQARTMIEQQKIRPEMESINKKFKGDPMKRNQAIMQLYREHNVNPLGALRGCVPMLLQMPVFLALYVVFAQAVELRGQDFLWIRDLAAPDHFLYWGINIPFLGQYLNILPILMGITNYIQMNIMRMPANDEMQEKIQKQMSTMMPIMFVFFLYALPSGLILYWIVSNTISIGQSIMTKRIIAKNMADHEEEKAQQVLDGKNKVAGKTAET